MENILLDGQHGIIILSLEADGPHTCGQSRQKSFFFVDRPLIDLIKESDK